MRSWKSISFQEPGGCPWLVAVKSYRHFSASALLTAGVKFLLSVSLSSKAVVRHHCQATSLHICTITQDVELRFFQGFQALCCRAGSSALIRVRNHSLLKHLFCGWGTSARCCGFEDVIAEKNSHVPVHGILDVWPWVCCLTPTKISYKQFFFVTESFMLTIVEDKCSVFFKVYAIRNFYNQLCRWLAKAENW